MSGIAAGTQLSAPMGYLNLQRGVTYYFLRSSAATGRVTLINFIIRPGKVKEHNSKKRPSKTVTPTPYPQVVALSRSDFERGLSGPITRLPVQHNMPPWLEGMEGLDLAIVDSLRIKPKCSHLERIDSKLDAIHALVANYELVLDSENPDSLINKHSQILVPRQNETRVRLWFYTYLLFGRNRFALHYSSQNIGRWSRGQQSVVKRGRPSFKGKEYGYNTNEEMIQKIIEGYRRESDPGIPRSDIYVAVIRKDFGCKQRWIKEGNCKNMEIYHPSGKPFPEQGIFFYYVEKHFGVETVQRTLWGQVRMRSKVLPTVGPFTEKTWNLMQRVESDAYSVRDLARGLIEGSSMPPLHVIIKRDTASGKKTGIGFTQGGERSAGYRMATFCEAISIPRYFKLFGIEIPRESCAGFGVAPHDITDRGPGSTPGATSHTDENAPVISEMSPAYSGQSKAVVEGSHPKHFSNSEAPSYVQTNLRTFELARREMYEFLKFNETCFVESRISPDLADKVSRSSPNGLWEAFDSLGRNDAVQMSFDEAVRSYLDKLDASLTRDGVLLHGQLYKSPALDACGARSTVSGDQVVSVKVFFLEACIRHVWLQWKGQLIELDLTFAVPVANEVKYMSMEEAKQYEKFCIQREQKHVGHRKAAVLQIQDAFEENVGKNWGGGSRVSGRPKRGTKIAKQEASETKAATRAKKAA